MRRPWIALAACLMGCAPIATDPDPAPVKLPVRKAWSQGRPPAARPAAPDPAPAVLPAPIGASEGGAGPPGGRIDLPAFDPGPNPAELASAAEVVAEQREQARRSAEVLLAGGTRVASAALPPSTGAYGQGQVLTVGGQGFWIAAAASEPHCHPRPGVLRNPNVAR